MTPTPTVALCPYCPRPLPDQTGRVTCGRPECHRRHRASLQAGYHQRHRDAKNAAKARHRLALQDGRQCPVCQEAFYVTRQSQSCCARPRCRNQIREQRRAAKELAAQRLAATFTQPKRGEILDLRADQIDAILDKLASNRRATRTWLRLDDETILSQRAGSALHQRGDVATYDLEGAYR